MIDRGCFGGREDFFAKSGVLKVSIRMIAVEFPVAELNALRFNKIMPV